MPFWHRKTTSRDWTLDEGETDEVVKHALDLGIIYRFNYETPIEGIVEALIRQAMCTNRNAYIRHTTGAGKRLTSIKAAQILAANPDIKKVIFLSQFGDIAYA